MSDLTAADFGAFFRELHGYGPFPWQSRLAEQVCGGGWPKVIDLPTASGKTACIDIALFALAVRGKDAPRRIFFVVDRRVIADEAFARAEKIAKKLRGAEGSSKLGEFAKRLKALGGDAACALKTTVLRGGTYRDETWLESPMQPAVIASTVDQVGSRLLFRGYGMRSTTWPLHAGMIGNDALIFLDEAHCSNAFAETLKRVEQFRGPKWAEIPIERPFHFVQMTATPAGGATKRFGIEAEDREDQVLRKRLRATKPTRLILAASKMDDFEKLADTLVAQARDLAKETAAKRVAVIVNRVQTAKLVFERLNEAATLVIGRMRPLDRDELNQKSLTPLKSGEPRGSDVQFVVATQCLEVGADLDFDVVVSECASIDALLQRFGRLDRLGEWGKARGAIVAGAWQLKGDSDAVYGDALKESWEWLNQQVVDGVVEMGIEAADGDAPTIGQRLKEENAQTARRLRMENDLFPTLLPSHLDALVQTGPSPAVDPEVELFLHGKRAGAADAQVVWRADLDTDGKYWGRILELCPPCSAETMPVQFVKLRKWLSDGGKRLVVAGEADLEGTWTDLADDEDRDRRRKQRAVSVVAFVWREGKDWTRLNWTWQLRPGDTVVLREDDGGWEDFGHIPEGARKDIGDAARFQLRRRVYLRLHPRLIERNWPESEKRAELLKLVVREDLELSELMHMLTHYPDGDVPKAELEILRSSVSWRKRQLVAYPDGKGYVLAGSLGDTKKADQRPTGLKKHLQEVAECAEWHTMEFLPGDLRFAIKRASEMHDYGKVDPRFQAWLRGGDVLAERYAPELIAKSGRWGLPRQKSVGLPKNFRHELLSLLFAEKKLGSKIEQRDLILHLIGSHHGVCRPFAPLVVDEGAQCVEWDGVQVCRDERLAGAAHKLESGVAERFWDLTRRFGWWGLAYLEGLVRLADWKASSDRGEEVTE
jgi:CRISPR-associated endonuclease/helicase Cas3